MADLSPPNLSIFVGQRVVHAWELVEKEIKSIATKQDLINAGKPMDGLAKAEKFQRLLSTLVQKKLIEKNLSSAVWELSKLGRNLLFRQTLLSITPSQILDYEKMSSRLQRMLESPRCHNSCPLH